MLQAEADCAPRLGIENVPAFVLALSKSASMGLRIVRMDLDRKPFAGENIFGEQRQFRVAGKPDLADARSARVVENRRQVRPAPGLFDISASEFHSSSSRIGR